MRTNPDKVKLVRQQISLENKFRKRKLKGVGVYSFLLANGYESEAEEIMKELYNDKSKYYIREHTRLYNKEI